MIKTITFSDFTDEFKLFDRDNFSYDGMKALYEYLEDYEEQTETPIELDVIALCCEYTEYEDLKELQGNYNNIETIEELENNTQVIRIEGSESFIIADF